MAFLKESPRMISGFFLISGILGIINSIMHLEEISDLTDLSEIGQVYRVVTVLFLVISIIMLVAGIAFNRIATKVPKIVISALIILIFLKIITAWMVPETTSNTVVSILIAIYLLLQYKRISRELKTRIITKRIN